MIVGIRTDKPEAELYILATNGDMIAKKQWYAHKELLETIHHALQEVLDDASLAIADIDGIVIYGGTGSFTGLRIGFSVANALAAGLHIPIVQKTGEDWLQKGVVGLEKAKKDAYVEPVYGEPVRITQSK